jgi:hypothetical protein
VRTIPDTVPPRNRTLAPAIIEWANEWLVQPHDGAPMRLTREMVRIVARFYSLDDEGRFMYRRGSIRRCKGWSKSYLAAVLGAVELCGPCRWGGWDADGNPIAVPHHSPWVQVAACTVQQTQNTTRYLHSMFSDAALDEFGLELGRQLIHSRHGELEAVTSNPRALEGGRPTFSVLDESQEWVESNRGHEMAAVIRRNAAKLSDARSLETSNAYRPGENSVAELTALAWEKAGGAVPGLYFDSLEAPDVPDLSDTAAVRAALEVARGDSVWLDLDRLVAEIQDPATLPSAAHRYFFNRAVETADERWMDPALWESAARPDVRIPREAHVTIGFDGSRGGDWTAVVAVWIKRDGTRHVDVVQVWKPAGPDSPVPVLEVEDAIRACFERWSVREVIADPTYWARSLEILDNEHRGRIVSYPPQRVAQMVRAAEQFAQAIATGTLTHSGDPDLTRAALNAVAKETRYGSQLQKRRRAEKIDPLIAAVMAHERSLFHQHSAAQVITGDQILYGVDLDTPLDLLRRQEEAAAAEEDRERAEALAVVEQLKAMVGA